MNNMHQTAYLGVCTDSRGIENPSDPLEPDDWWNPTPGHERITPETAVNLASVWQAVNVLSGDVAQLPAKVYRRNERGREADRAHPAWRLVHRRPAPHLGPFQFKQLMMMRVLLHGNAYAYIRKQQGIPVALQPLEPSEIVPELINGQHKYVWTGTDGNRQVLDRSDIFHLRGPGGDLLAGQSVISIASDSLWVGKAAQKFGGHFFENDATPRIVLHFPEAMSAEAIKNTLKHFESRHSGPAKAGRPAVMDKGGKIQQFSMSNEDAQFLQTREYSRGEVASWFNLPPHKVGDLTRATFSNIEQQSIDYVVYGLMPWLIRWQEECNEKLFSEEEIEADSHYCEFSVTALLRGDSKSRAEFYQSAIAAGWMTPNEARVLENLNEIEGLSEPMRPLNMAPAGGSVDDDGGDSGDGANDIVRSLYKSLLDIAVERGHRRVVSTACRSAGKPGTLQAFIDGDLARQRDVVREAVRAEVEKSEGLGISVTPADEIADAVVGSIRSALLVELEGPAKGLRDRVNSYAAKPLVDTASFMES